MKQVKIQCDNPCVSCACGVRSGPNPSHMGLPIVTYRQVGGKGFFLIFNSCRNICFSLDSFGDELKCMCGGGGGAGGGLVRELTAI